MLTGKVRVSTEDVISGRGLIATEVILRDEVVWVPDEDAPRRTAAEVAQLPPENFHCQLDADLFVFVEPAAWCFNHSCGPNTFLRDGRQVAVRDIAAGEEVTYDYGLHEIRWRWRFACDCGSPGCRRKISSRDYLDRRLMKRWEAHVATHVRDAARDASWLRRLAYRFGVLL